MQKDDTIKKVVDKDFDLFISIDGKTFIKYNQYGNFYFAVCNINIESYYKYSCRKKL